MNTTNVNHTTPVADYTLVTEIAGADVSREQVNLVAITWLGLIQTA